MNFSELQRETIELIKDQSPTILASVGDYINEVIGDIAERIKFPELKQVSSITTNTSTYWVNMPTTFSSRLTYAGTSTGEYAVLDGGIEELIRIYPSLAETGDIEHVVCEGGILYYHPIPATATVVTCIGYHKPVDLVNDNDTPSFIPTHLHREAVVNGAASKAYNAIEDGQEDKINMKLFRNLSEGGIVRIMEYVSRRRQVVSSSCWSV